MLEKPEGVEGERHTVNPSRREKDQKEKIR
jgi:hypothetical protein